MHLNFKCLFPMVAVLTTLLTLMSCVEESQDAPADRKALRFVSSPTAESWAVFKASLHMQETIEKEKGYQAIVDYHYHQLQRDLPNSHSHTELTPEEYVRAEINTLDSIITTLKEHQAEDKLWGLLSAMSRQTFDETLVWTASEIAIRLSRSEFENLYAEAKDTGSTQEQIYFETLTRWENKGLRRKSQSRVPAKETVNEENESE